MHLRLALSHNGMVLAELRRGRDIQPILYARLWFSPRIIRHLICLLTREPGTHEDDM